MIEFGNTLKAAREAKGLTIKQIAEATHMMVQIVECLEREDFTRIVAPIYGRGFVKLYCEAVDIDPKPMVAEFMDLYTNRRPPTIHTRVPQPAAPQQHESPPPPPPPQQPTTAEPSEPAATPPPTELTTPHEPPQLIDSEPTLYVTTPLDEPQPGLTIKPATEPLPAQPVSEPVVPPPAEQTAIPPPAVEPPEQTAVKPPPVQHITSPKSPSTKDNSPYQEFNFDGIGDSSAPDPIPAVTQISPRTIGDTPEPPAATSSTFDDKRSLSRYSPTTIEPSLKSYGQGILPPAFWRILLLLTVTGLLVWGLIYGIRKIYTASISDPQPSPGISDSTSEKAEVQPVKASAAAKPAAAKPAATKPTAKKATPSGRKPIDIPPLYMD